ncbi:IMP4 domain-containing protein [Cryptosporidium canis]|uniref:IMP4 domain-containing protein n=1 Tax=Cryptosporidium canis TaxID=195482 RepID=A0ABQ8P3T2_9CRYT|nr:IMP4 domain-containing protein [Cryptosporidium canis]KAJ1615193.1 IMP4 domain-containing protein [Cryptosporidium canis]
MPKVHGKRKKTRTHTKELVEEELKSIPKCFVLRRGKVIKHLKNLVMDLRYLMSPWSAIRLQENKYNKIKDFISIAGPLGISHILAVSQTVSGAYLRLIVLPSGPTATFKIENFSLMHDIRSSQKRPRSCNSDYLTSPLLVLNGMKAMHSDSTNNPIPFDLLQKMINGMFPAIDLTKTQIKSCKRVVLIEYNKDSQLFELRHYAIIRRPAGVSKSIKRLLLKTKDQKLYSIGRGDDMADYILSSENGACASDSEVDDEVEVKIPVSDKGRTERNVGLSERSGIYTGKVSVSLKELGPRISMRLVKIVDEVCDGAVLYHRFVKKNKDELKELEEKEALLKEKRQREMNLLNCKEDNDSSNETCEE